MWKLIFFFLLILTMSLYPFSVFSGQNFYFGVLISFYFILQIAFASKNFFLLSRLKYNKPEPSVCFLLVGHRENPSYWEACLDSIQQIKYNNISGIVAFIDGNEPEDEYMKTIFEENFPSEYVFLTPQNGKRSVLYEGFLYIKAKFPQNEYIIVVDSDTIIEPEGVRHLVSCIESHPNNGCATGNIQIFNRHEGILPKIVHARYGYAFTVERSAMSAMGVMNCCSGPFSIYRQSFLKDDLIDQFYNQAFCGKQVGPGDDRHLTLLMLKNGHFSRQTPFAIATTETPITIHRYLQQQIRWMRSFYREMFWQVQAIPKQSLYLSIITVYELFFPFFVLLSFLPTFKLWPFYYETEPKFLIQRAIIALGILILRTCLLCIFNRNTGITANCWNLLVFPLYFIFLLPLKIYAIVTCPVQSWMTSSRKNILCNFNLDVFFMYMSIFFWWGFLGLLFGKTCFYLKIW